MFQKVLVIEYLCHSFIEVQYWPTIKRAVNLSEYSIFLLDTDLFGFTVTHFDLGVSCGFDRYGGNSRPAII